MIRSLYTKFHAGERSRVKRIFMALTEGPGFASEFLITKALEQRLAKNHEGDGQGVIVIPGFLSHDNLNLPLIQFLNNIGYNASGWNLGRNTGPGDNTLEKLLREIDFKFHETGEKVTLVGHSLGGIYAREMARQAPHQVERVISLGSPFARRQSDNTVASKLYWKINESVETGIERDQLRSAPEVPTTSVFTRADGIIKWQSAKQVNGHNRCENIEVYGSHCGLSLNPTVWSIILDRLQQDSHNWQQFSNEGWKENIYPIAELAN